MQASGNLICFTLASVSWGVVYCQVTRVVNEVLWRLKTIPSEFGDTHYYHCFLGSHILSSNKGCEWGITLKTIRGDSLLPFNWSLGYLTLILLKPKVISLCHHYTARPACTSVQSDQTLYWWLTNLKVFTWKSLLKMIMDRSKNGKWIIPFKELSRLRVNWIIHDLFVQILK